MGHARWCLAALVAALIAAPAGLATAHAAPAPTATAGGPFPAADRASIERDVRTISGDALQGRALGTPGLQQAMVIVAQRFAAVGLEPARPEGEGEAFLPAGHPLAGYLQPFRPEGLPAAANVVGLLPGADPRPPRALVLGAHLDHLGRDASLSGDQIYNGADDNASGVAALIEIARLLAAQTAETRDRTVIFIAFSAEENGLLGSRYYCDHPVVPHEEVVAMINLDGVGHMENRRLFVCGTGSAQEFAAILRGLNNAFGFDLVARPDPVGGSDHVSFLARGVPALFLFTGPHADYSTVRDEADLIRYDELAAVTDFAAELARYLRYRERGLTFVAPSAKDVAPSRPAQAGERRVSLGFIPDFARAAGGVKVGAVTPGGAAAQAGLETGDVITAIDADAIDTLADYAALLRGHAPGDGVTLTVVRGGRTLEIAAKVQERK